MAVLTINMSPKTELLSESYINLINVSDNWVIGIYINTWVTVVIKYEYILGGNTVWNVKHATLSDFENRRRAVFVFGEVQ